VSRLTERIICFSCLSGDGIELPPAGCARGHPLEDRFAPCSHADLKCGRNKKEETMSRIILAALITSLSIGTALAQSCESRAMSSDGKPLHGAAKNSFVKKCKRDACESKAVSKEGKPLYGAAKNSFLAKCKRAA
jgi:hypothetical protein